MHDNQVVSKPMFFELCLIAINNCKEISILLCVALPIYICMLKVGMTCCVFPCCSIYRDTKVVHRLFQCTNSYQCPLLPIVIHHFSSYSACLALFLNKPCHLICGYFFPCCLTMTSPRPSLVVNFRQSGKMTSLNILYFAASRSAEKHSSLFLQLIRVPYIICFMCSSDPFVFIN